MPNPAIRAAASACALSLTLAGCAELNSARDYLADPKTQAAVITLKNVATAIVCDVSTGSALALAVEKQVGSHQGTTTLIYTASSLVCQQLQGTVVGTASNVQAVASVAVAK